MTAAFRGKARQNKSLSRKYISNKYESNSLKTQVHEERFVVVAQDSPRPDHGTGRTFINSLEASYDTPLAYSEVFNLDNNLHIQQIYIFIMVRLINNTVALDKNIW